MSELFRGVVKWFNDAKGFGFIEHTTGKDVFVHYSVIESEGFKTLKDGEEVEYELKEGEKGLHAARVSRPNAPLSAPDVEKSGERNTNGQVAPNLEGGLLVTVQKSATGVIEVEQSEFATANCAAAVDYISCDCSLEENREEPTIN